MKYSGGCTVHVLGCVQSQAVSGQMRAGVLGHLVQEAPSDEGVCQLGAVPVSYHGLIPVGVPPAAQVGCVGCEVRVEALQEAIRPAHSSSHAATLHRSLSRNKAHNLCTYLDP